MGKVRKPELTALNVLFTAILTVCGKVNFMNLSRYSDRHEKTYRRQSKKGLKAGKFNAAFVSLEIDRFYNGSHGQVERGLELSLLAVVDTVTENAYAIHASQTYSPKLYPLMTRTEHDLAGSGEPRQSTRTGPVFSGG
jgi:hypothetical protein